MIFARADDDAAEGIREVLQKYEKVSGQEVNYQKSSIVFSPNVKSDTKDRVLHILGVEEVDKHDKYLGLPTVLGTKKREVFQKLRDRIWDKIKGWSEKTLSQAGKEILIKAVLQAIPSYAMSCFKLPDSLIGDIEQMIRSFWWNSGNNEKIHWAKWEILCKSKQEGGLGFRDLKAFNLALLAKQGWRILTKPNSLLSLILKACYFKNVNFLEAPIGYNPSFTWRSIFSTRQVLVDGSRWRVGNGENISIWEDRWIPRPATFKVITHMPHAPPVSKVAELMHPAGRAWNEPLIRNLLLPVDADVICNIPLGSPHCRDRLIWHFNKNGRFSVKSAYRVARFDNPNENEAGSSSPTNWNFLWQARVAPKIKVFIWKLCKNALPTLPNLKKRQCEVDITCQICELSPENRRHVFFECTFARQFWALSNLPWQMLEFSFEETEEWVRRVSKNLDAEEGALFFTSLWAIWWHRNKRVMEGEVSFPEEASRFAKNFCSSFLAGVPHKASSAETTTSNWQPPPPTSLKINFDGAIFRETNEFGWGICVRDQFGSCVVGSSLRLPGNPSPELAETHAAAAAVDLIIRRAWSDVILEGDCKVLLDKLAALDEDLSDHGNLVSDIKEKLSSIPRCKISIIRRHANCVAHLLARNANIFQERELDIPDFVYPTFVSDIPSS